MSAIDFIYFLLTLIVAFIGGLISYKLKLPAGAMLGALFFVIIFNLTTDLAYVPRDARVILQIIAGIVLGSGITRRDVITLKIVIKPGLVLIGSMIFLNLFFGFLMHRVGGLDLTTALFATAPGGLTDMALIADELGANMLHVSSLQLFRILFIFATLPALFTRISRRRIAKRAAMASCGLQCLAGDVDVDASASDAKTATRSETTAKTSYNNNNNNHANGFSAANMGLTILFAAAGGLLLWMIGINAGALIGSMLAVAALNIKSGRAICPKQLRIGVQMVAGGFIGQTLDRSGLQSLQQLLIPLLIMMVSILTFTLLVSFLMSRLTRLDAATCLIASSPGGVQEMALIAEDLEADPTKVIVLQMTRLMTVIIFFPTLLATAAALFG